MSYTVLTLTSQGRWYWVAKRLEVAFANKSIFTERKGKKIISKIQVNLLCTYLNSWLESLLCLIAGLQQQWWLVSPFVPSLLLSQRVSIDRTYGYTLRNHTKPDSAKISTAKRCFKVLPFKSNFNRQLCTVSTSQDGSAQHSAAHGLQMELLTKQFNSLELSWAGTERYRASAHFYSCGALLLLLLLLVILLLLLLPLLLLSASAQMK